MKGYCLCRFEVNIDEVFTANKKRGEHANPFEVVNHRGQLGHLKPMSARFQTSRVRSVFG